MVNMRSHYNRRGFTLIELLVVIAIIAILAAILFPVFAQAKLAAQKTVDITRMNQVGKATMMYTSDSEDRFFMSNSGGPSNVVPGWGFGPPDAVPGQVLQPYAKNTTILTCPLDPASEAFRLKDHEENLPGGSVKACVTRGYTEKQCKDYAYGARSNSGLNYAFFSPWRLVRSGNVRLVTSATVSEAQVASPANTLMFANAIWDRNPTTGVIRGGGNWVVETPCWMDKDGKTLEPMLSYEQDGTLRSYAGGWEPPKRTPGANGWLVYGGIWPFHNQVSLSSIQNGLVDGQAVTMMADSSVRSRPIRSLTEGCTAYGTTARAGKVTDLDKFIWDLN